MTLEEHFRSLTFSDIEGYVAAGQEEHLHLDFKRVKGPSLRSEDDKRTLAQAISGYANSAGGLIIWGVDARKGPDQIDRAQSVALIEPVKEFLSRLNELTGSATDPIVDGIEHKVVMAPGSEAGGVAVTIVPESPSGPHMAKLGENRYYKRSGDSFYRMEHFDIADMFGRRKQPDLYLSVTVVREGTFRGGPPGERHLAKILISITNSGRGTAAAPYLSFRLSEPYFLDSAGVDGKGREGLPRLAVAGDGHFYAFGGSASYVLHPDTQIDVCAIWTEISEEAVPPELSISYTITAQDARSKKNRLVVPGEEIVANAGREHGESGA